MLTIILILVLLVLSGILIYLATLEGSYSVRCTQMINADINTVYDKIRDFKSWSDWSPWLIHEPDTRLEFSQNFNQEGGCYTWDGQHIGAGKLTHVQFEQSRRIEQKLEFTRPFKSICDVGFDFKETDGKTEISWYMHAKMPFLFRFMTAKTKDMISKDYALGLAMLNGQLDSTADYPVLHFLGETTRDPVNSLCQGFSGGLQAMEETMKKEFPRLLEYIETQQGQVAGAPFTAYHKSDPKTLQFVCDMAIPVAEVLDAGDYQLKKLGGGRYYKVTLQGSYQFLEMAWCSAISHIHLLKFKFDKGRPSLEVYENDPNQVSSEKELLTTLYIAIK